MIESNKKIKGEDIERIKFNEVRIDNWVLGFLEQKPLQVDWLTMKHLSDGNVQAAFYDHSPVYVPIPLTPGILEKCGFKLNRAGELCIEIGDISTHLELVVGKDDYYPSFTQTPQGSEERTVFFNYITYLHQLQNLYFALTQTELPITL